MSYKNYLEIAKEAAKEAGDFLLQNKLNEKEIYSEEGRDIKLQLDRETEELIRKKLEPTNIPVLGEEFGGEGSLESERWVIDPIDGTANYFRGLDQCCISIALMDKNEALVGVVYNFNNGEMYAAAKELGCYLNDSKVTVSSINKKRKGTL